MRNADCGITGSAVASAAVRRALAPNIWPGDKRICLHARDAKPTTRASLVAPEAGALPSQFSHGAIRANFDLADFFKNIAWTHTHPDPRPLNHGERSRLGCGSARPRAEHLAGGTSESVCTRATRGQRRGRRWLRPRRARSPANSVTVRFVRISIWRIFLRISRGII